MKKRDGFTLIEIIFAMTLLSMITVIVAYGYRLGIDAWRKGEKETTYTQQLRVLSGLLSQQIKSAYPYKIKIDEDKVMLFEGKHDSLMFVTTLTDSSFGGFKWIRYSYKDGTMLYKEGLLPDKKFRDKITGKEKIVDKDIDEVQFWYLSPDDKEWSETWDPGEHLPVAVKVKVSHFQPFIVNIPMGYVEDKNGENSENT